MEVGRDYCCLGQKEVVVQRMVDPVVDQVGAMQGYAAAAVEVDWEESVVEVVLALVAVAVVALADVAGVVLVVGAAVDLGACVAAVVAQVDAVVEDVEAHAVAEAVPAVVLVVAQAYLAADSIQMEVAHKTAEVHKDLDPLGKAS